MESKEIREEPPRYKYSYTKVEKYDNMDLRITMQDNGITDLESMRPLLDRITAAFKDRMDAATLYTDGLQVIFKKGQEPTTEELEAQLSK